MKKASKLEIYQAMKPDEPYRVARGSWGISTVYNPDYVARVAPKESIGSTSKVISSQQGTSNIMSSMHEMASLNELEEEPEKVLESKLTGHKFMVLTFRCVVLADALTQFKYLEGCNNEFKIIKAKAEWNNLKTLKYNIKLPEFVDELEGKDLKNLNSPVNKIRKLEADRNNIKITIRNTFIDLIEHRSFNVLSSNIKQILDYNEYREHLKTIEAENKKILKERAKELKQRKKHITSALYSSNIKIENLRYQIGDSDEHAKINTRFIDNWQVARTEQNNRKIADKENIPITNISYFKQRMEQEHRVNSEVGLLMKIAVDETMSKIEYWMEKYDRDMENIDLEIQISKNNYLKKREEREDMEEKLERQNTQIKDWIHFKEEREKARLYHEKMTNSAITVQAWWRGLLVRLQLGPYKPKKERKRKDKK